MTRGSTILDDRETVEFLRDHPHLLAVADAVRATQGPETRILRRRKPLLVAAATVAACAAAAGLVAFFAVPGGSQHSAGSGHNPVTRVGSSSPPTSEVGSNARGLPAAIPLSKASSDAMNSFGVPLILPNTSMLKASDAESTAFEQSCSASNPDGAASLCQITVQFPSPPVGIEYAPTASTYWGSHYPNALDQYHAEIAQSANPRDQIVYLGNTPALIDAEATGIGIEFRIGELSITVWAPDTSGSSTVVDAANIQALAKSMVDQAGP